MFYIIGLGNPGDKYKYTRHNIAWFILDELFPDGWSLHKYMNAEIRTSHSSLYIKPQTFMNKSGEVVSFLKKDENFDLHRIILIYDDLDLPFQSIRISYDRGDGGHNGVKSIINHLGSRECIRIRIGISKKTEEGRLIKPNVLGNFSLQEQEIIKDEIVPRIEQIIQSLEGDGLEKTMNRYN